jgi:hypothetical protein
VEEDDKEEEGHDEERRDMRRVRGWMTMGWGDRSASGSASTHRFMSSHLISPPVAPREDNRIAIVPCGDG